MPGSINSAARQNIQPVYSRGAECNSCITGRPAFIARLAGGKNDPIAMFKQNPHQTANALSLLYHEAHKDLPADFRDVKLSHDGNDIKSLIGVIYSEVMDSGNAQDIATLQKVCKKLMAAEGRGESRERKVSDNVSALVAKYITPASEKMFNQYIDHCIDAWEVDHQTRGIDTTNKATFKQCLDVCKAVLMDRVGALTKPDKSWETMAQQMRQVASTCAAMSKTMIAHLDSDATPEAKGPDALDSGPQGHHPAATSEPDGPGAQQPDADNQRLFIPNGQGGITLNITSKGGSVGDITQSVAATPAKTADPHAASVKHILDSGLSNEQKVDVLKALFQPNAGGVLHNLTGVQGFKSQQGAVGQDMAADLQSVAKQTEGMHDVDAGIPANPTLAQGTSCEADVTDVKPEVIAEQGHTPELANPANDGPVNPTDVKPEVIAEQGHTPELANPANDIPAAAVEVSPGNLSKPAGELLSGYKAVHTTTRNIDPLNRRNSSQRNFLPTNDASASSGAEGMATELQSKFAALKNRDASAFDRLEKNSAGSLSETLNKGMTASAEEPLAWASSVQRGSEQPRRTSSAERFQPAQLIARRWAVRENKPVYTTERTVNVLNRSARPAMNLPTIPESDSNELDRKFADLEQRSPSAFDFPGDKEIKPQQKPLAFQEKLAEFKRRAR